MVAVNPKMVGWMIIVLIVVSFVAICLAATSLTMAEKKVHAMIISVAQVVITMPKTKKQS